MHKAIVKCDGYDVMWEYVNNLSLIEDYKNGTYSDKIHNVSSGGWGRYNDFHENGWENFLIAHGIHPKKVLIGEVVLWEGEMNLERLRDGDNLWIPFLNSHLTVSKVNVNPNGEIVYYVDYNKYFYENGETSRLGVIEDWLNVEYPTIEKFNELHIYKDRECSMLSEFRDLRYTIGHLVDMNNKIIKEERVESTYVKENITLTKSNDDSEDELGMIIGAVCGLGIIFILVTIAIMSRI